MGLADLKKELKKFDKEKLIELIADLYKKNKSVKEYFDFYVSPDENELLNTYRDKVFEAFYPKRGYGYKLKDGKQAIIDFKKFEPATELLANLMLFYVESGVKFTNDFGDVNEAFYKSLATTFVDALKIMDKENLLNKFEERVEKIVDDTSGIGWGFHDYLVQVWFDFYPSADVDDDECEDEQIESKNN